MRPLILIGAGGHCRSVIEAAESAGMVIAGVLERDCSVSGKSVLGYPVLGDDNAVVRYAATHDFVITLGMIRPGDRRAQLARMIETAGGRLATVVASTARVSPHASIGAGTVILHQAVVNAGASVGGNSIINTAAVVEHDAEIGFNTHVSTGAIINGGAKVGDGCMLGSHSTVLQGVRVCDRSLIGAGALVVHDVTEPGVYKGII